MNSLDKMKLPRFLKRWLSKRTVRIGMWVALFFVAMLMVLSFHFVPERTMLEVGQVCPNDIQSNQYMRFVDTKATVAKQNEALKSFNDIYKVDLDGYNATTVTDIADYFNQMEKIILAPEAFGDQIDIDLAKQAEIDQKMHKLKAAISLGLTDDEWREIAGLNEAELTSLHNRAVNIASNTMSKGVLAENLPTAKEKILSDVSDITGLTVAQTKLISGVLNGVNYQATYVYDQQATEDKKAELLSKVDEVMTTVLKGELIVSKGEVLTESQMQILMQIGYTKDVSPWIVVAGLAILLALVIYIGKIYLQNFAKDIYANERQLILLMLLVFITITMYKLILSINLSTIPEKAEQVGFLIPVAMGTMLIAILLDARLAIMVNIIFAAFVGLYTGAIPFMIVALISGIIGVVGVSNLSQRSDLSRTALLIGAANTVAIVALGMLNSTEPDVIFMGVIFGLANGFFSSVLTIGILPYLENVFGITTSIKLLELANPNQPLLKKLLIEAPGTYHHCIMVGNLGEAAADAIGASGLAVRIGAYYHDIGKTKRPYFFAENQFSDDNPHDRITPTLSTLILTSHVKDGVEMAQEAHIPPIIVDLIAQHHGNSLVSFFYHKAKENGEDVREADFRYDQQKPQTKEAAILMMADTVEAAVRSKKNATPGQIEGFIRTLIKGKLNDGQFDECDLTFKDLDKIANAFVRVVNGIYHKRIEYPDQNAMMKQKQGKKGKKNVNNNQQ